MGWMTGSGPLGRKPAGQFNFEAPEPGWAVYLEPAPKRIRVEVGGEVIADSRRAFMLHESGAQPIYYFPPEDVRSEFLQDSDRHTHCPKKGDASYYTIKAGGETVEAGAWYYPDPLPDAPAALKGLIAFYFNRMGRWREEGEEIGVHPRDPYHRVDVLATDRDIQISLNGKVLAQTSRAMACSSQIFPLGGTSRLMTSGSSSSPPTPSPAVPTREPRATTRSISRGARTWCGSTPIRSQR